MRVAIDMDETLVDLTGPWFDILNKKTGKSFTRDDVNMYDCEELWGRYLTTKEIFEPFHRPGFWENLPPLPGAIGSVKLLWLYGFDIYVVSSPWRSDNCAWEKTLWVEEHLDFIGKSRLILTRHKHLINAHFFVDDHIDMIQSCNGVRILIDRKWNRDTGDSPPGWYKRVHDMTEAASLIMRYK